MVLIRTAVIFCVVILIVGGCGNQSIIDKPTTINNGEGSQHKITIWHTYSEEETEVFENQVLPLFEEEHPEIDVIPVRQAHSEQLRSAIISRASSNQTPDIVRMDIAWLPLFAELNLLYPVSDFEDFTKISRTLYDEPLQSNFYEDKYYGLPLNTNTKVSIFNKRLLKKAGLNHPPQTMEEILSIAEQNGYQIGITGLTSWEILPYFYSLGGKLMDEGFTHAKGFLDSQDSIDAVKILLSYQQKGVISDRWITKDVNAWQGIQDETYFMIDEGPWFYSVQSEEQLQAIKDLTVFAPYPVTHGVGSILGGENLVITKGTKEIEAAWTFLKWMVQEEPQSLMLQTGLIPTNTNIRSSKLIDQYPYYKIYAQSIEQSFLRPPVPEWNQIDKIFQDYLTAIFLGNMTAEHGLKEAAEEIENVLKQERGRS
ncbi:extracellular solute-binding protein [Bacillus sp. JJ1566]|uniref:extracellular solute-binding protein n=1 Tax=Bacillus sp. JJ1566 TaxID=3122961 RepID=UPI002FFD7FD3